MSSPGGEPGPAPVQVEGSARDQAQMFIAARDLSVTLGAGPASSPAVVTSTLPRDAAAFTGRGTELRQLIAAAGAAGVVAIHTVDGMPGVGKTALVTRAAHLLTGAFPDGQLFVWLHAHTPGQRPADPGDVLADLLACTGMTPGEIPAGVEARAQWWRDRLAGKKVLL
jgi:hypothetical protein